MENWISGDPPENWGNHERTTNPSLMIIVPNFCFRGKKRKHKTEEKQREEEQKIDLDAIKHGGWWKTKCIDELTGAIALEFGDGTYVKALDNGLFTLGSPHNDGDGPSPEEILTAIPVSERKIALKSGYGKYLKIDKDGMVTGRSDAIGAMEQWEPVYQDGKAGLSGYNDCFMSIDPEDDALVALCKRVGEPQVVQLRSQAKKETDPLKDVPTEEKGNLSQVELNYM